MMYLGWNPVGLITHDSGEWNVTQIIATSDIVQRADLIKTWIEANCPESSIAIVIRDNYNTYTNWNGTLLNVFLYNGVAFSYIRYYGNKMDAKSEWGSNYYLSVATGDSYTIFYK